MRNYRLLMSLFLLIGLPIYSWSNNDKDAKRKKEKTQILIVGLADNVKSNYYYNEKIAEETGIPVDRIHEQFNLIIAQNIASALPNSGCTFIAGNDNQLSKEFADQIEVKGEGENSTSSLSNLPSAALEQALAQAQASYLLVLNQHYLKRQEQPMRTVFHIVSYTLYDKNKKEILSGNQFFTYMKLESPEKIKEISRKSSSKIATSIVKSLDL